MVKLGKAEKKDETIQVSEMKCGQIGIITEWVIMEKSFLGSIVQRNQDKLIVVGEDDIKSFVKTLSHPESGNRVRLLEDGEKIVISKNK